MFARRLAVLAVIVLMALPTMAASVPVAPAAPSVSLNTLDSGNCIQQSPENSVAGSAIPYTAFDNKTYIRGSASYVRYSQHLRACSGYLGFAQNGDSFIWAANIGGPGDADGVQLGIGTTGDCFYDCFYYTPSDSGLQAYPVSQLDCNMDPTVGHRYEFLLNLATLDGEYVWQFRIIDRTVSPNFTCNWYRPVSWITGVSAQTFFETIYRPSVMDTTGSPYNYLYSMFIENSTSGWVRQCPIDVNWEQGPDIPYIGVWYTTSTCTFDTFYVAQY